jgi:ssDNA-binding Zn-finger/Zn-ribbon topoisomerase 1
MAYFDKKHPRIFHVCSNCPTGSAIVSDDKEQGTPLGSTRCPECDNLQLRNQCSAAEQKP